MKTLVRVEYIPLGTVWSGNINPISDRLTEIHNDNNIVRWEVEYLNFEGKMTGAIITNFIEVDAEELYV